LMSNLIALGVGIFVLPLVIGSGLLLSSMRNDRRLATRFAALHQPTRSVTVTHASPAQNVRALVARAIGSIGGLVLNLGLLSRRTKGGVEAMLRGAGYSGAAALRLFVGAKLLLLLGLPAGVWLLAGEFEFEFTTQLVASCAVAVVGLIAPDTVVGKLRSRNMNRIENELPDALDMMVICAQAGLGLGMTIVRVAQELRLTHRAIAVELAQTANEMQMMTDGKRPLINLGERCGVDSAKRLAATLVQSAQYGTPLTEALRALGVELRAEMITRFEARAARMPVLLTLPMVAFILPSLFMIIGGPAVVQVMHAPK
jgi:tight adherence protein C